MPFFPRVVPVHDTSLAGSPWSIARPSSSSLRFVTLYSRVHYGKNHTNSAQDDQSQNKWWFHRIKIGTSRAWMSHPTIIAGDWWIRRHGDYLRCYLWCYLTVHPMYTTWWTLGGDLQNIHSYSDTCIVLGMSSANERRRYNITSSLIGWAYTQNDTCQTHLFLADWTGAGSRLWVAGWCINILEITKVDNQSSVKGHAVFRALSG